MLSPCPLPESGHHLPRGFQRPAHDQHPEATGSPESTADPREISGRRLGRNTILSFENSWDSTHFTYICVKKKNIYIYVYIQDSIYKKKNLKGLQQGKESAKLNTQKM